LLESIKPAYNQSWLDSWLKFTASAFYQLMTMDQYAGSPGRNTDYYGELAASFINLLHYCFPSSGFYGAGKDNRGRCTTSLSGHELHLPPPPSFPIFTPNALSAAILPIYPGLGQAPYNAVLHTQWLV